VAGRKVDISLEGNPWGELKSSSSKKGGLQMGGGVQRPCNDGSLYSNGKVLRDTVSREKGSLKWNRGATLIRSKGRDPSSDFENNGGTKKRFE